MPGGRLYCMRALPFLALLPLCGCSGGGASTPVLPPSASTPVPVVFDTHGGGAWLTATVDAVSLERVDGSLTPDLLVRPVAVTISDPIGASSGIELRSPPAGDYVALLMALRPGSIQGHPSGGAPAAVGDVPPPLRVPLQPVFRPGSAAQSWLLVRHGDAVELVANGNGGFDWRPDLAGERRDLQPLFDLEVEVVRVDRSGQTVTVTVAAWGDVAVRLLFDVAVDLQRAGRAVTPAEFVGGVGLGERLEIDGLLQRRDALWVLRATDRPRGRGPATGGNVSEARGLVETVDAATGRVDLDVLAWRKLGRGVAAARRLVLGIGPKTLLRWLPAWGRPGAATSLAELRRGMLVSATWHGPLQSGVAPLHRLVVEAGGPGRHRVAADGVVRSVDPTSTSLVLAPAGGTKLVVGPHQVTQLPVELEPDAIVVRQVAGGGLRLDTLAGVGVGEPGWVLGRWLGNGVLRGDVLLLRRP